MATQPLTQVASHALLLLGSAWLVAPGSVANAAVVADGPAALAPALMLAKSWLPTLQPRDYLVSEKLDGVRAFWDGRVLRFRSGRPIAAPDWFTAALPPIALDGELWLGRGRFDQLSGAVRRAVPVDAEWRALRYMIFDLPGASGTFAQRSAQAATLLSAPGVPAWLQAVEHLRGSDPAALARTLRAVVQGGGEGLMLHRADAQWSPGRSDDLRKFKPLPDEDGRVLAHLPGKGRHAGRLGALWLETPTGLRFALGTGFTDEQRAVPPIVGAVVTYRYRDRTPAGLPRFASFVRVREAE
jgi:DNA ligase 1